MVGLSLLSLLLLAACRTIAQPEGWAAPVEDNGTVLAALDRGKLSAIDLATGQELWRFPPEDDDEIDLTALYGTPAIGDRRVYVGAFNGTLYALDLESGGKSGRSPSRPATPSSAAPPWRPAPSTSAPRTTSSMRWTPGRETLAGRSPSRPTVPSGQRPWWKGALCT